jgi:hypothetical protein
MGPRAGPNTGEKKHFSSARNRAQIPWRPSLSLFALPMSQNIIRRQLLIFGTDTKFCQNPLNTKRSQ